MARKKRTKKFRGLPGFEGVTCGIDANARRVISRSTTGKRSTSTKTKRGKGNWKCRFCRKAFKSAQGAASHQQACSEKDTWMARKTLTCLKCGADVYNKESILRNHLVRCRNAGETLTGEDLRKWFKRETA